jgi:hypothetical protein
MTDKGKKGKDPKKPNGAPTSLGGNMDALALQIQKLAKNLANPKDKEKY